MTCLPLLLFTVGCAYAREIVSNDSLDSMKVVSSMGQPMKISGVEIDTSLAITVHF